MRAIDHGSPVASVAFSPDGTLALSIGKDGTAQVWDAASWQPRGRITTLPSESRERGAFSPDNRLIAFWSNWVGGLQALAWCDSQSGRVVREVTDSDNDLQSFDWRPDGQQLLRVSKWGEVTLWSALDRWQVGMTLPVASAPARLTQTGRSRGPRQAIGRMAGRLARPCSARWKDISDSDFRRCSAHLGPGPRKQGCARPGAARSPLGQPRLHQRHSRGCSRLHTAATDNWSVPLVTDVRNVPCRTFRGGSCASFPSGQLLRTGPLARTADACSPGKMLSSSSGMPAPESTSDHRWNSGNSFISHLSVLIAAGSWWRAMRRGATFRCTKREAVGAPLRHQGPDHARGV